MDEATWDHAAEVARLEAQARREADRYLASVNTNAIEVMYTQRAITRALEVLRPYIVIPPPPEPPWWRRAYNWLLDSRKESHGK